MQITQAIEDFLIQCKVGKNLSPKTLKAYSIDLKQFSMFLQESCIIEIEEVDKNQLKAYAVVISSFAPRTIKRKIATLKAFFSYHEFEENILTNPFRKVRLSVKLAKSLPKVMTLKQIEAILSVAYQDMLSQKKVSIYTRKKLVRDVAVLELLFATGIRVAELCSLTLGNVDSNFEVIKVVGKGSKERTIPITNSAVQSALKSYYKCFKEEMQASFFVNRLQHRLSEQSVRYMVAHYAKKAKISQRITPHVFRHTFATLLLEKDVDIRYIQHILGHSSISVTQIYTHVNDKKKHEILSVKHPRNEVVV